MLRFAWLPLLTGCVVDYVVQSKPPEPAEIDSDLPIVPDDAGDPPIDTAADAPEAPIEPEATDALPEPPEDDCAVTSDLIYLLSRDDQGLYLFDPATFDVRRLGSLDCTPWAQPASMGVARDGRAYVRMSDDSVWSVDLTTLRCAQTGYRPGRTAFGAFGMGFATDQAGGWQEHLYVANGRDLARLDTATWRVDTIGRVPSQPELTGDASGALWALLPLEVPAELRQLDKATGRAVQTRQLRGFPAPLDIDTFAFAAWGGEHWLFVRTYGLGHTTDVYRVDVAGRMTVERRDVGVDVVGAGSSTCAPTAAP
ncbi:MAG TPA: hypothetical protein PKA64_22360 [Myxococcota bacterium]|nr:hypothetical protein [Myxococcota bacterium]